MSYQIAKAISRKVDCKRYMPSERICNNDTGIGVELEYENIHYFAHQSRYPNIYSHWKTVEDGSLRAGTEFIFDGPLVGANAVDALDLMQSFIDVYKHPDNGKPILLSERCSVHVHMDVTSLTQEELNNFIFIYYLVERIIFQHINPSRSKNNYCRPLTESSFKYIFKRLLKAGSIYNLVDIIRDDCDKYSALNVLPITKYGSIEFRHHHGSLDMKEVLDWINIILSLRNTSQRIKIADLLTLSSDMDMIDFISYIFEGSVLSDKEYLSRMEGLDLFLYSGKRDIKEIIELDELSVFSFNNQRRGTSKDKTLLNKYLTKNNIQR